MKIINKLSLGAFILCLSSIEGMAMQCPLASDTLHFTKCVGHAGNYTCSYNSRLWEGRYASPVDITRQQDIIRAVGHAQNANSCRYDIQTSSQQLVSYVLTYKEPR